MDRARCPIVSPLSVDDFQKAAHAQVSFHWDWVWRGWDQSRDLRECPFLVMYRGVEGPSSLNVGTPQKAMFRHSAPKGKHLEE